jgi:hypothetical protein
MKIIGYTVGTPLPKPNLKQTDPTKGDYVKGKEILDEKYIKVDEQELTEDQKAQARANVNAVSMEEARELIDGVTTSKVNVADIVNNLTTNVENKPLSAAQGVALKDLIDVLQTALDEHAHGVSDISGLQAVLDGKAAFDHGHDDKYYTKDEIDDYLNGKTQVQIITWGSDD